MLVAAPSGFGKTVWVQKLLSNLHLIEPPPRRIIWCYSYWQPAYDVIAKLVPHVEFVRGIPLDLEEDHFLDVSTPNLIIFDDLMGDVAKDKRITELFTKGCHHRNLSVICMVQNFYFPGTVTMRRNCHYLVLFDMPGDKRQISTLAYQMYPSQPSRLLDFYRQSVSKPYGYILIDLKPQTEARDRLKTDLLGEYAPIWPLHTRGRSQAHPDIKQDAQALKQQFMGEIQADRQEEVQEVTKDPPEQMIGPYKVKTVIGYRPCNRSCDISMPSVDIGENPTEMEVDPINEGMMDEMENNMQKVEKDNSCPDCGIFLRTPFNLATHVKEWCPARGLSTRKKRRLMEPDDDEEKPVDYGFESLLEEVKEELAPQEEEEEGGDGEEEEAPDLAAYNKLFRTKYHQFLDTWFKLQDNPIHQKIMSTMEKLVEDEDYSQGEAIAAALRQRKELFNQLFEEEEEEEDSQEQDGSEEEEED